MTSSALMEDSNEPFFYTRTFWKQALFLAVLSLGLNLIGNGKVGLWDRDEPRYAGAVREMKGSGEWVVPRFNAEPRYHKPILIYWLMSLGTEIGGDNPFGTRLVSSISTVATALLLLHFARSLLGPSWGFLGTLMFAVAPIVVAEAKLATTDAALAFFFLVCQVCLWRLAEAPSRKVAILFWVAMSLAILTKGPVAPFFVAVAGVASWWFGGPTAPWRRLEWKWGLPLCLALVLPWYIAVGVRTNWAFYGFAFGEQVFKRVTSGMEEHGGFPGYYIAFSLVTFFPWSALVPAALLSAWSKRKSHPQFGFLLGWALGPLIVLEIIKTKLIHYYLPCFPALALLSAFFLRDVASSELLTIRRFKGGTLAMSLLGGVGISMAVGLFAALAILPTPLHLPAVVLGVVVLAGTLLATLRFHQGATTSAAQGLVATWSLVMVLLGGWFLPAAEPYRLSRIVGERLAVLSGKFAAKPVLVTYQEPGIIYALGRPAPTMRNWNLVHVELQTESSVVAPMFEAQLKSIEKDPRFRVEIVEEMEGFNLNKGQQYWLKFARISLSSAEIAARDVGEKPLVK